MTATAADLTITIGTRRSQLAQWQTRRVASLLEAAHPGLTCTALEFSTAGDRTLDRPIPAIGGKGAFTQELEDALRDGRIDAAVHSLKDLPVDDAPGLTLGAICERDDARDVFVSAEHASWADLPDGARVGTSSVRRRAQVLAARPGLEIAGLRGNVDTRVRKALAGEYDGVILAAAGLHRLALTEAIREYLPIDILLPAPGQGALAVQCRADDESTIGVLGAIDDASTRAAVAAERAFLAGLGGGCSAPVGAYATVTPGADGATVALQGVALDPDGRHAVESRIQGPVHEAQRLGRLAAASALADGADRLLAAAP